MHLYYTGCDRGAIQIGGSSAQVSN